MPSRILTALVVAGVALTAFGAGALAASQPSSPESPPVADVQLTYGTDAAAPDTPVLPGFETAAPPRGEVAQVPGPFDDRFVFGELRFSRGVASGEVTITSDVSELIDLEVVAGFYDADGVLLGTSSFVHHGEAHAHSGPPELTEEFEIRAPASIADRAVSASVGVPVLVNE